MSENIEDNFNQIDKDLSHVWIDLSDSVRKRAADLKVRAEQTELKADTIVLSDEVTRLCDHVESMHADVVDLLETIEERLPQQEIVESPERLAAEKYGDSTSEEVDKEKIQIQRESHEMRSDFKDVLKALFMWVDDPKERIREKK